MSLLNGKAGGGGRGAGGLGRIGRIGGLGDACLEVAKVGSEALVGSPKARQAIRDGKLKGRPAARLYTADPPSTSGTHDPGGNDHSISVAKPHDHNNSVTLKLPNMPSSNDIDYFSTQQGLIILNHDDTSTMVRVFST